jgi:hypothetical protein
MFVVVECMFVVVECMFVVVECMFVAVGCMFSGVVVRVPHHLDAGGPGEPEIVNHEIGHQRVPRGHGHGGLLDHRWIDSRQGQ